MTIPAAIHTLVTQLEAVLLAAEAALDDADAIGLEPSEAAEDAIRYAWTGYYQFVAVCTGEPRETPSWLGGGSIRSKASSATGPDS